MDCILKRDIIYTKANPKFHHWQTYDKRFGLTFERCDDAKAFDIGIQQAVADLVEGEFMLLVMCQFGEIFVLMYNEYID